MIEVKSLLVYCICVKRLCHLADNVHGRPNDAVKVGWKLFARHISLGCDGHHAVLHHLICLGW